MLSFDAEYFVFSLLSKNIKVKLYRRVIWPVVCVGVKLGRSH